MTLFLRAACLLSCGGRAVGNVRVVINASELLSEVKIVDFSIVIKLHQLLKVIKPEVYMESIQQRTCLLKYDTYTLKKKTL